MADEELQVKIKVAADVAGANAAKQALGEVKAEAQSMGKETAAAGKEGAAGLQGLTREELPGMLAGMKSARLASGALARLLSGDVNGAIGGVTFALKGLKAAVSANPLGLFLGVAAVALPLILKLTSAFRGTGEEAEKAGTKTGAAVAGIDAMGDAAGRAHQKIDPGAAATLRLATEAEQARTPLEKLKAALEQASRFGESYEKHITAAAAATKELALSEVKLRLAKGNISKEQAEEMTGQIEAKNKQEEIRAAMMRQQARRNEAQVPLHVADRQANEARQAKAVADQEYQAELHNAGKALAHSSSEKIGIQDLANPVAAIEKAKNELNALVGAKAEASKNKSYPENDPQVQRITAEMEALIPVISALTSLARAGNAKDAAGKKSADADALVGEARTKVSGMTKEIDAEIANLRKRAAAALNEAQAGQITRGKERQKSADDFRTGQQKKMEEEIGRVQKGAAKDYAEDQRTAAQAAKAQAQAAAKQTREDRHNAKTSAKDAHDAAQDARDAADGASGIQGYRPRSGGSGSASPGGGGQRPARPRRTPRPAPDAGDRIDGHTHWYDPNQRKSNVQRAGEAHDAQFFQEHHRAPMAAFSVPEDPTKRPAPAPAGADPFKAHPILGPKAHGRPPGAENLSPEPNLENPAATMEGAAGKHEAAANKLNAAAQTLTGAGSTADNAASQFQSAASQIAQQQAQILAAVSQLAGVVSSMGSQVAQTASEVAGLRVDFG